MVTFDGDVIMIEPNWAADGAKQKAGPQRIPLADLAAVEWIPNGGMENGRLRFTRKSEPSTRPPIKHDPAAVTLWGLSKETRTVALLVTAVVARLPHPLAEPPMIEAPEEDHDVVLRRLRELGALHRDGVLTDEEFATAKQALVEAVVRPLSILPHENPQHRKPSGQRHRTWRHAHVHRRSHAR